MKHKKLFAILTLVCFMFTLVPVAAFAEETTETVVEVSTAEQFAVATTMSAVTIKLTGSFELSETVTVGADQTVVLDLNGQTITGKDTTPKNFELIMNKGNLTVKDSVGTGKITLIATNNNGWSRYSAVITNRPSNKAENNVLTIESGTLQHLGGTSMAYAIDNNSTEDNTNLVINGGTVDSAYIAIRQFANSETYVNNVTIEGENATVNGTTVAAWIQLPGSNGEVKKATLTIKSGLISSASRAVYASSSGDSFDGTAISISGGTFNGTVTTNDTSATDFITGGTFSADPSAYVAEGKVVTENADGTYTVADPAPVATVNGTGYYTLAEAIAAVEGAGTVKLTADIELDEKVTIAEGKNITLDLNGKNITVTKDESTAKSLYAFYNAGTLTLEDSVGNGSITARGIENYGTMTMNGGTIIACDTNGGYGVWNYGDFTMNGGTMKVTHVGTYSDTYGPTGLGNMAGATMTIVGGNIESVNARSYVVASQGSLTIAPAEGKEVKLEARRGVEVGGGTAVIDGGTFEVYFDEFVDGVQIAPESYLALYVYGGESVTVNGGTFTAPDQSVWSAAESTPIVINDGYFSSLTGKGDYYAAKNLTIYGGTFEKDPSAFVATGYAAVEKDGVWTIELPATGVTLDKTTATVAIGETVTLTATVTPANTTDVVTWASSDVTVATVDANGVVTGVKDGKATITATVGAFSESCEVTIGHVHEYTTTEVKATCTTDGYKLEICTCGDVKKTATGVATNHNYTGKSIAATCTTQGYTTYTCENCGHSYIDAYTAVKGHAWGEGKVTTPATGNTEGSMIYTCSDCKAEKNEVIPATGCDYKEVVTAPTCTEQGYTTYTCKSCTGTEAGHSYIGNYVAAKEHSLISKATNPTCTAKGYTTHSCQNCSYSVKSAVIDMLPHSYEVVSTEPADSDKDGLKTYKCSGCEATKTEVIPALGHSFTSAVTKVATCEEDGVITYTCENESGHTYTEIIPATGHNWVQGAEVIASCISSGYTPQTCACGAKQVIKMTDMIAHTFDADHKCTTSGCTAVDTAALSEEEKEEKLTGTAAPLTDADKISDTLSYNTTTALQEAMEDVGEVSDNQTSSLYDISLKMNDEPLKANNFPAEGHVFKIERPAGTTVNTVFTVYHMITETYGGRLAGDIETLPNWVEGNYVCFRTYSTSPVLLSYEVATTSTPSTSGGGFSGSYNYPVNDPEVSNGKATLSESNAIKGETVVVTATPDNGYGVYEVIVTDKDGNVIPTTDNNNGTYSFVMPAGGVDVQVVCKPAITLVINDLYINVFGKTIKNDVAPIIAEGNRTMLPIRAIAEALGADVDWDPETQKVTITTEDTVIEIFIGKTVAYINGEAVQLDAAAFIDNNRTYLQVRFISEALNADVN